MVLRAWVAAPKTSIGGQRDLTEDERQEDPTTQCILIAEDNAVNRKLAVALVKKWGFSPIVANNGEEALAAIADEHVDLILMDVQMPVMDGLEATRAIRDQEAESGGHLPIVALTAHAYASDTAKCLSAGMDEFLTKPIDPQALHEAVLRLLASANENQPDVLAEAGASSRPPLLDRPQALERLDGDLDLLEEIATLFLESCDGWLEDLRRGVTDSDADVVRRSAHTLKGSAASFGARPLVDAALRVEKLGAAGDLTEAAPAVRDLESLVDALANDLRSLLEERES